MSSANAFNPPPSSSNAGEIDSKGSLYREADAKGVNARDLVEEVKGLTLVLILRSLRFSPIFPIEEDKTTLEARSQDQEALLEGHNHRVYDMAREPKVVIKTCTSKALKTLAKKREKLIKRCRGKSLHLNKAKLLVVSLDDQDQVPDSIVQSYRAFEEENKSHIKAQIDAAQVSRLKADAAAAESQSKLTVKPIRINLKGLGLKAPVKVVKTQLNFCKPTQLSNYKIPKKAKHESLDSVDTVEAPVEGADEHREEESEDEDELGHEPIDILQEAMGMAFADQLDSSPIAPNDEDTQTSLPDYFASAQSPSASVSSDKSDQEMDLNVEPKAETEDEKLKDVEEKTREEKEEEEKVDDIQENEDEEKAEATQEMIEQVEEEKSSEGEVSGEECDDDEEEKRRPVNTDKSSAFAPFLSIEEENNLLDFDEEEEDDDANFKRKKRPEQQTSQKVSQQKAVVSAFKSKTPEEIFVKPKTIEPLPRARPSKRVSFSLPGDEVTEEPVPKMPLMESPVIDLTVDSNLGQTEVLDCCRNLLICHNREPEKAFEYLLSASNRLTWHSQDVQDFLKKLTLDLINNSFSGAMMLTDLLLDLRKKLELSLIEDGRFYSDLTQTVDRILKTGISNNNKNALKRFLRDVSVHIQQKEIMVLLEAAEILLHNRTNLTYGSTPCDVQTPLNQPPPTVVQTSLHQPPPNILEQRANRFSKPALLPTPQIPSVRNMPHLTPLASGPIRSAPIIPIQPHILPRPPQPYVRPTHSQHFVPVTNSSASLDAALENADLFPVPAEKSPLASVALNIETPVPLELDYKVEYQCIPLNISIMRSYGHANGLPEIEVNDETLIIPLHSVEFVADPRKLLSDTEIESLLGATSMSGSTEETVDVDLESHDEFESASDCQLTQESTHEKTEDILGLDLDEPLSPTEIEGVSFFKKLTITRTIKVPNGTRKTLVCNKGMNIPAARISGRTIGVTAGKKLKLLKLRKKVAS